MKYLKAVAMGFALLSSLSACSTLGTSSSVMDRTDSRYAALLDMGLPEFYGTLAVASTVSNDCAALQRNPGIDLELNERRNEQGNGSFAALTQRQAIRNSQNSMTQEFQSRYGSDLCSVATRDFDQAQKPYTFFLQRSSG